MGKLLKGLKEYVDQLDLNSISVERKDVLQELIDYVNTNKKNGAVRLNFICTHNSRRSQFSQLWGQVASYYYDVDVESLSGGTEATAFNERAVKACEKVGFEISSTASENPIYSVKFSDNEHPLKQFSKVFDDEKNGSEKFAAIMTCSHADENCPFIPQADKRIPVRYNDPKEFDDTDLEELKYDERCKEIATELFYVFQQVSQS